MDLENRIQALVNSMTIQEKIQMVSGETYFYVGTAQMFAPNGYGSRPWKAAVNKRLGIEGVKFVDGPRGIVMKSATTFPVGLAHILHQNTLGNTNNLKRCLQIIEKIRFQWLEVQRSTQR
jgi:hypothetical protein